MVSPFADGLPELWQLFVAAEDGLETDAGSLWRARRVRSRRAVGLRPASGKTALGDVAAVAKPL